MSDEPQVVKGGSMLAGSPRNLSLEQQQLVRRMPPPAEAWVMPPPAIPAHVVDLDDLARKGGPYRFAQRALAAGYTPLAVASVGPTVDAKGRPGKQVAVVTIRCSLDGQVEIVACWTSGRFDVAFGRRADGGRRMTTKLGDVDLWLDHGVEADLSAESESPTARQAALLIAAALGGSMVASKVEQPDGSYAYLCPVPANDVQAAAHLRDMHGLDPVGRGDLERHMHEHGWPRNHVHVARPVGEA